MGVVSMNSHDFIWGWKRDSEDGSRSRTVYLRGQLQLHEGCPHIVEIYFYLRTCVPEPEAERIRHLFDHLNGMSIAGHNVTVSGTDLCATVEIGEPSDHDKMLLGRLQARSRDMIVPCGVKLMRGRLEPDAKLHHLSMLDSADVATYLSCFPCDLYVGSGLSYEAGVPLLAALHEAFGVDNRRTGQFLFGLDDPLPEKLLSNPEGSIQNLLQVELAYLQREPSTSHRLIAQLQKAGLVQHVFTDNVDDFFERAGVDSVRTRGHGLFNERFDLEVLPYYRELVHTDMPLLVVGVSADRRQIIEHMRQVGRRIVIVNPIWEVSPQSRNMDYLKDGDLLVRAEFRQTHNAIRDLLRHREQQNGVN